MSVKFDNYSESIGLRGKDKYYHWRVFVNEPPQVLDQIEHVEYHLHSSFPEPFQVRSNKKERFALDSNGWGEFTIMIVVTRKDGEDERVKYHLVLDPEKKPWLEEATG